VTTFLAAALRAPPLVFQQSAWLGVRMSVYSAPIEIDGRTFQHGIRFDDVVAGRTAGIEHLPVKRIRSVRVGGYLMRRGMIPFPATGQGRGAASAALSARPPAGVA
jgi:hypothetical protein